MLRSEVTQGRDRLLEVVRERAQETAGRSAVADAMVEGQRDLGDLAHGQRAVDDPGAVDDPAQADDRDLGVIDDGGRAVDAEDAVVVDRDRAAQQVGGREGPGAGPAVSSASRPDNSRALSCCAFCTTGTTRPRSVCAAKPRCTAPDMTISSPSRRAFNSGKRTRPSTVNLASRPSRLTCAALEVVAVVVAVLSVARAASKPVASTSTHTPG